MTTVCWDGVTLAADSRGTAGNFGFQSIKLWRLADGRLYAGAGDAQDLAAVRAWLESGGEKPKVESFAAMVIGSDRTIWRLEEKLVMFQVVGNQHAMGSGRDFATAAMACGRTARQAIEIACLFDIYSAPPVAELTFPETS